MMPSLPARKLPDIAAVIRAVREDAEMSQAELADKLGFSRDYMIDLESGRSTTHTTRLFRVLHELGISITLHYPEHRVSP